MCICANTTLHSVALTSSFAILLLAVNYLTAYTLVYAGRRFGRGILALFFIANAASLYFINTYKVYITPEMMGNVFHTHWREAYGFWNWKAFLYILFAGIIPAVCLFLPKVRHGSFKRFAVNAGVCLAVIAAVVCTNFRNVVWVHMNLNKIGSLVLPWSYTVNSFKYVSLQKKLNRQEILLPDVENVREGKAVVVLVIGESARQDHFSLYGYERNTNPLLSSRSGVRTYMAESSATYTIAGVRAILEPRPSEDIYEFLPNYLYRNGVDVVWRTANSGEPALKCKVCGTDSLTVMYPGADSSHDAILCEGLKSVIESAGRDKVFIVLHTGTSHGPDYASNYPAGFEVFSPVNRNPSLCDAVAEEVINAYDNTIVYTDYILDKVIRELQALEGWDRCMIFVSDHGESLGENGLYMHGMDMMFAPREQYEIPFIVWTDRDACPGSEDFCLKESCNVSQNWVFHSTMDFLGLDAPFLDKGVSVITKKP